MKILTVGISHKTAPIEIREKFYFRSTEQELLLSEFKNSPIVVEAIILSTCNRTEIYANVINIEDGREEILRLLFKIKNLFPPLPLLKSRFYTLFEREAVEHLFRVSTGLDSLVLGDKQILGQVKEAIERSRKRGMMAKCFNILSNIALRTGKKAHNETQIGHGGSSASWAAVALAEDVLGAFQDKSVLIIGAGKMSHLAAKQLKNKGVEHIYVMNRTCAHAVALVERFGGKVVPFCDIKEILNEVDVCICATDAPHYILERNTIQKVMDTRKNRKLLLVDVSMPRDVDPQVARIDNVLLFTIDDLGNVVEKNMKKRQAAIRQVEEIVIDKISEFYRRLNKHSKNKAADDPKLVGVC